MTIGASHRAALHLLVATHALAVICTFESNIRALLTRIVVIDDDGLMALPTSRGGILRAMVVALRAIARYIGMLAVREFNRPIDLRYAVQGDCVCRVCQDGEYE